jgi:hypothetical protein
MAGGLQKKTPCQHPVVQRGVSIPHRPILICIITLLIICEKVLIIILICNFQNLLIGLEKKAVHATLHTNITNFGIFLMSKTATRIHTSLVHRKW